MLENKISEQTFVANMFDPEFFEAGKYPDVSGIRMTASVKEFFGTNVFSGPLYDQMALIEMKYARKKIFRGTLNAFVGKETFFPLVNLNEDHLEIKSEPDKTTICCVERTVGLVTNSFLSTDEFNSEKFRLNINELKIGTNNFKIISGFIYNEKPFLNIRSDAAVRSRWVSII